MEGKLKFTMPFEPLTIEHLGLKLYGSLPPVIGELVSNAWDAEALKVEVTLPEGEITDASEVLVRDFGLGMDAASIQDAYLPIGRNCRDDLKRTTTPNLKRPLMGRKGIGKLSAFGVATELEILTIRNGNAICIRLNYDEMKAWPKDKPYEPTVIAEKTGKTREPDGTQVRVSKLHRSKAISKDWVKRELARRYTVIGSKFQVFVNGEKIIPADRRLEKDCKHVWNVSEMPNGSTIDAAEGLKVKGWFGLVEKSSQADRGVDVFAHGKAVELATMFGLKTTHIQWARSYVVGEVHADFLDEKEDDISTGRNMAHWESGAGQKLQEWGASAVKYVLEQWLILQKKEKEEKIIKIGKFNDWLKTRSPREQAIAKRLVKVLVDDDKIEPEATGPVLEMIKTNIEFQAFQELVDDIEKSPSSAEALIKLFGEWRIFEAREHLKLADGRADIMEKLDDYIQKGALEVKQIQPLFEQNGWLVNPAWGEVTGQNTYTDLLRKHCKESTKITGKNRRMDILGYEVGGTLHVVELKRPEKTLSREYLEQIERYVDWARNNLIGTGPDSPKHVTGLLIVGQYGSNAELKDKRTRLAGSDIRVETFRDLSHRARKVYGEVEERLRKVAPEYSRQARKARKK